MFPSFCTEAPSWLAYSVEILLKLSVLSKNIQVPFLIEALFLFKFQHHPLLVFDISSIIL